jgi:hypothetical protein
LKKLPGGRKHAGEKTLGSYKLRELRARPLEGIGP